MHGLTPPNIGVTGLHDTAAVLFLVLIILVFLSFFVQFWFQSDGRIDTPCRNMFYLLVNFYRHLSCEKKCKTGGKSS